MRSFLINSNYTFEKWIFRQKSCLCQTFNPNIYSLKHANLINSRTFGTFFSQFEISGNRQPFFFSLTIVMGQRSLRKRLERTAPCLRTATQTSNWKCFRFVYNPHRLDYVLITVLVARQRACVYFAICLQNFHQRRSKHAVSSIVAFFFVSNK